MLRYWILLLSLLITCVDNYKLVKSGCWQNQLLFPEKKSPNQKPTILYFICKIRIKSSFMPNRVLQRGTKYQVLVMDILNWILQTMMLCCSNVVQVPLSLNPFQLNLEFGTTHRVQMCYTSKQV